MFRGTTPSLTYHITSDLDFTKIDEIWITLANYDTEETFKLSESEVSVDADAKTITISLSQENTLAYEDGEVDVQMRLLDTDGIAYATDIKTLDMKKILKDGVIE